MDTIKNTVVSTWIIPALLFLFPVLSAQNDVSPQPMLEFSSDSMPPYHTLINAWEDPIIYQEDERGNRVPDYSYCGYMASEQAIPDLPVRLVLRSGEGDATARIQAAIDEVSALPADEHGFRGAVLLEKGLFIIEGSLLIESSGVVLRGSGCGEDGTILRASGNERETLIQISGKPDQVLGPELPLADRYHPVNSLELFIEDQHNYSAGDLVLVKRPSTLKWLKEIGTSDLGMSDFRTQWSAGDFDLNFLRQIVRVTPESIVLDAPLTEALDPEYGGGSVLRLRPGGRLSRVGLENLRCESTFDSANSRDENHRWMAVTLENVSDAWVRRVVAKHFVSSAVAIWENCRMITVEDCKSLAPVGEEANYRRLAFQSSGQQVLFQRCYAEHSYHAFSVGFTSPGPNAFVQCHAKEPLHFSGAVGGWSAGILFDGVSIDGGDISFAWRDMDGQGGGWSASNSLCWQCRAAKLLLDSPPGSRNWAYGCWAQPQGDGIHVWPHTFLRPHSIFYDQLDRRLGFHPQEADKLLIYNSSESTAPQPEEALRMSRRSAYPDVSMDRWIDSMISSYPLDMDTRGAEYFGAGEPVPAEEEHASLKPIELIDGRLVCEGRLLTGKRVRTALWRGSTRPADLKKAGPHLSRFVPGRSGQGLTDDLEEMTTRLSDNEVVALSHFPSLWYERRRDDHNRTRRSDADVWTPFYEQPFSRSGKGQAFDGLSRYDLGQWNPWYWSRLDEFAQLADRYGILFIQEHYLQHNIIEEGGHWADYPWRSVNNINKTGFAEAPHYSGDKRIYMAGEFYDTTHPVRKHYHREYIRKSLENLAGRRNVLHDIGHEYTGPLHFMQFWLDELSGWENEKGENALVLLQATKDVQDAILNDPVRSAFVDAIDLRQWHYREDGTLYAPEGGLSLTQRQYARIFNPGNPGFRQIYRAVSEYRVKYPGKAVISSLPSRDPMAAWASFMAGGSLAEIPLPGENGFLELAAGARAYVVDEQCYVLENPDRGIIAYLENGKLQAGMFSNGKRYLLRWLRPSDGLVTRKAVIYDPEKSGTIESPFDGPSVAWLTIIGKRNTINTTAK